MSEAGEDTMSARYTAGDHAEARRIAQRLADRGQATEPVKRVLGATDTDWFLSVVGLLGLGLVAGLVYKYVL